MTAALSHPGKKGTKSVAASPSHSLSNTDRVRAWLHRQATSNDLRPVVYITNSSTPSWKEKKTREQVGSLSVSPELRAYYAVLHDLRECYPDNCRLAFVTLNFSATVALQLASRANKESRPLATIYGKRVTRSLREAVIPAAFFAVIEDSGGHSRADRHSNPFSGLHAHILIAYHVDDEHSLKALFRRDKNATDNGMVWQQTYQQTWKGRGKADDFPLLNNKGKRYRMARVNGGVADYISKDLHKTSRHLSAGDSHIYCPNQLRTAAKQRYERLRQRVITLDNHREELTSCTLHQILSFAFTGRLPS